MRRILKDGDVTVTVEYDTAPVISRICSRCGDVELSDNGKARVTEFAGQFSRLFEVQTPDLTSCLAPDGSKVLDFAVGVRQRHENDDESKALDVLLGKTIEMFRRTFGEYSTGRKLWWRERPNVAAQVDFYTRAVQRVLWMRFAIPDLTNSEVESLAVKREGEALQWEDV